MTLRQAVRPAVLCTGYVAHNSQQSDLNSALINVVGHGDRAAYIQIFIHQLVVAKKIQYIHTYKYKEMQQTRKNAKKKQKMQYASVHSKM